MSKIPETVDNTSGTWTRYLEGATIFETKSQADPARDYFHMVSVLNQTNEEKFYRVLKVGVRVKKQYYLESF